MTTVVDTSALVAVILGEPDAEIYAAALVAGAGDLLISAVSRVEAGIIVEARQGPAAADDLGRLLEVAGVEVAAVDDDAAAHALAAWRRFGRGRHPAALNFGDCFPYALARSLEAPLLFKGDDFTQTDIRSAL